MILIDSVFINTGGGKTLLDYFIKIYLTKYSSLNFHFLLDKRLEKEYKGLPNTTFVENTLFERYKFYKKRRKVYEKVLCFGNIPPPIRLDSLVYTYFHQAKLLHAFPLIHIKELFILYLKKLVFIFLHKNSNKYIVQTPLIKKKLQTNFTIQENDIYILPFYDYNYGNISSYSFIKKPNTFLYVSNAGAHKNHVNLINAFALFYLQFNTGVLYLTVSNDSKSIIELIDYYKNRNIPIINLGLINRDELHEYYQISEFFIFPSLIESFGLGLIEALQYNCKLIAANLEYTYEVCDPTLVFDPLNVNSILNSFIEASSNKKLLASSLKVKDNIDQIFSLLI